MDETSRGTITVEIAPEARAGVYCDMAAAYTKDEITRLDFIQVDGQTDEPGNLTGALVSRVFMSNADLVNLRDMLSRHIDGWHRS